MVYTRCFWQGNHKVYGHIWCNYAVLANPTHKPEMCKKCMTMANPRRVQCQRAVCDKPPPVLVFIWRESLVARGQARLFGVAGSNPPGSVSTSLSDSNVSVSLIHACGVNHPCIVFLFLYLFKMWDVCWNFLKPAILNPVQRLHREHVITTTSDRNAIAL